MSITLTTPVQFTINGATENDTIAALVVLTQDFSANTYTAVFRLGTSLSGTPLALNQGSLAGANGYLLTVIFNIYTGVFTWTYAGNSGGGTLAPGATLTMLQNQCMSDRNQAETFVAAGLLPGTQVPWTQL